MIGNSALAMVVSEDPLFRDAAAAYLRQDGLEVPAIEPDGLRALSVLGRQPIDVILVIGELARVSTATFKLEVERRWPGTTVVCVPASGASGSFDVGFDAQPEEVMGALRSTTTPPARATDEADHAIVRLASLTPRERTVLQRLAQGMRPAEIADELRVSRHTVRTHLANLHRKLDVHRRIDLIRIAAAAGLLANDDAPGQRS
jgi:DNA-binding NarL/FixJ family response regulator